jgi:hypothetical protein
MVTESNSIYVADTRTLVSQDELVGYFKDHPDQDPSNPDNYKDTPPQSETDEDSGENGNTAKRQKQNERDEIDAILAGSS